MVLPPDGQPIAGTDGMRVPMWKAPQGGKHIFAGARVRNLDICTVQLIGAVRDPATRMTRFEGRYPPFVDGGDGWAYADQPSQISSYANIPLCGNFWSPRDIHEETYELEITVTDREKRTATKKLSIVPFCSEPALLAECECECSQGYVLGECS